MVASQYPVRPALRHDEEEITGYVDPWVVSPGETAHVKVPQPSHSLSLHTHHLRSPLQSPSSSINSSDYSKALTCPTLQPLPKKSSSMVPKAN